MSVAMTNCGELGWVSDRAGYRYDPVDPETGRAWPAMPALFRDLAVSAAATAGFPNYAPDACLINESAPAHACPCTRIAMNATPSRPSCRFRWEYPQPSSGAGSCAPIDRIASSCHTVTSQSGAVWIE